MARRRVERTTRAPSSAGPNKIWSRLPGWEPGHATVQAGGRTSPWYFSELPPDFDAVAVCRWVEEFIVHYSVEEPRRRAPWLQGQAVRNAHRLVYDLCRRNPHLATPPEEPTNTSTISLHQEVLELRKVQNWCRVIIGEAQRLGKATDPPSPEQPSSKPKQVRLTVNTDDSEVILDNVRYTVEPTDLAFVAALIRADGRWQSSMELAEKDVELQGVRISRVLKRLKKKLQEVIESKPGKGYRLKVAQLA